MIAAACVAAVTLCGAVGSADQPATRPVHTPTVATLRLPSESAPPADHDRPRRSASQREPDVDFRKFHGALAWNFTRGLAGSANLWPLAIGAAGALAATPIDDEVSDEFRGELDALGDSGHIVGSPIAIAASTGALLLAAPFTQDGRFRSFAFSLAQAQILDGALKYGLKAAVSRTRPNGENENSFPSGHTSGTFAFATVAGHYYGRRVGIPAYVVAALVGASRVEKGKHFPSDVIFGATLGYIAGRTAIRGTDRVGSPSRFTVHPVVGAGRVQIFAQRVF